MDDIVTAKEYNELDTPERHERIQHIKDTAPEYARFVKLDGTIKHEVVMFEVSMADAKYGVHTYREVRVAVDWHQFGTDYYLAKYNMNEAFAGICINDWKDWRDE